MLPRFLSVDLRADVRRVHLILSLSKTSLFVFKLPLGRKIFRSFVAKPVSQSVSSSNRQLSNNLVSFTADTAGLEKYFEGSREVEIEGLPINEVFDVEHLRDVPSSAQIYGICCIDCVKRTNVGLLKLKSRLGWQNNDNKGARKTPKKFATITKYGQRILLSLTAQSPASKLYTRDIIQALIESASDLNRESYPRPVSELSLPEHLLLKAKRSIYGVPESPLQWCPIHSGHHTENLEMESGLLNHACSILEIKMVQTWLQCRWTTRLGLVVKHFWT